MKKSPSLSMTQLSGALTDILYRYHVLIFTLLVIGGLSLATFFLSQTVNAPTEATPESSLDSFDQETMKQIKRLRKPDEAPAPLELPSGRINPFIP